MIVNILHYADAWHYGDAARPGLPLDNSTGYRSMEEATRAAVRDLRAQGIEIEGVAGRPDKGVCRELGLKYRDPRGSDRRGAESEDEWWTPPRESTRPTPETELSWKKRQALERARAAGRKAVDDRRKRLVTPEGFRSVDHFLDDLRAYCGKAYGRQGELTKYLQSNRKSVSRWLAKGKYPEQKTLDAMAKWYASSRR